MKAFPLAILNTRCKVALFATLEVMQKKKLFKETCWYQGLLSHIKYDLNTQLTRPEATAIT